MLRSVASQLPRVSSAANSGAALRQISSQESLQQRPINRRLEVDLQELNTMQQQIDLTLIDVRQPAELHSQEQIPGSLHIPLGSLRNALHLTPDQWQLKYSTTKPQKYNRDIIFYARGPIASSAAVEIAHRMGFKKSRHYVGGWEDYCLQNNLPLTKPRPGSSSTKVTPNAQIQEHYNYHYYNPDLHYL